MAFDWIRGKQSTYQRTPVDLYYVKLRLANIEGQECLEESDPSGRLLRSLYPNAVSSSLPIVVFNNEKGLQNEIVK